jgi:hypothetical protein
MLKWRAEPGGHQQGSQFVAVQGGDMGLVVQPRPPDMRSREMVQELFLDRVLVEPAIVHPRKAVQGFCLPGRVARGALCSWVARW